MNGADSRISATNVERSLSGPASAEAAERMVVIVAGVESGRILVANGCKRGQILSLRCTPPGRSARAFASIFSGIACAAAGPTLAVRAAGGYLRSPHSV